MVVFISVYFIYVLVSPILDLFFGRFVSFLSYFLGDGSLLTEILRKCR